MLVCCIQNHILIRNKEDYEYKMIDNILLDTKTDMKMNMLVNFLTKHNHKLNLTVTESRMTIRAQGKCPEVPATSSNSRSACFLPF